MDPKTDDLSAIINAANEKVPDTHKKLVSCRLHNWLKTSNQDLHKHEGGYGSIIWSDHDDDDLFPELLPNNTYTYLKYKGGDFPGDFKGAVAYVDRTQPVPRKWVFALDFATRKVWVDSGPIGPIDWNVVRVNLDASTEEMFYTDSALKGIAFARVNTFPTEKMAHMGFHEQ